MYKLLAKSTTIVCVTLVVYGCNKRSSPTSPSIDGSSPGAVQSIDITSSSGGGALTVGQTRQLRATARLNDGSEHDITGLAAWTSDDPSVAAVSSGLVTAVGPGTGRIRAAFLQAAGETAIDVAAAPAGSNASPDSSSSSSGSSGPGQGGTPTVQSLTITGGSTVPAGRSMQLRAIAHMSDGTDRDVTGSSDWGSDNTGVASVTQSGVLTGVSPGANVVTARHNGTSASQPVVVTPL